MVAHLDQPLLENQNLTTTLSLDYMVEVQEK